MLMSHVSILQLWLSEKCHKPDLWSWTTLSQLLTSHQWIGDLWEICQEGPIFHIFHRKMDAFRWRFLKKEQSMESTPCGSGSLCGFLESHPTKISSFGYRTSPPYMNHIPYTSYIPCLGGLQKDVQPKKSQYIQITSPFCVAKTCSFA